MRILCVLLPHFPLQCERLRNPGLRKSTVVTYATGSQKRVLDYSPELHSSQRDMPIQQTLSLHGDIELVHADIPYYWSAFNELLDALELGFERDVAFCSRVGVSLTVPVVRGGVIVASEMPG